MVVGVGGADNQPQAPPRDQVTDSPGGGKQKRGRGRRGEGGSRRRKGRKEEKDEERGKAAAGGGKEERGREGEGGRRSFSLSEGLVRTMTTGE